MKRFLRKRGADTNQNIFYLVVAVIVLAAAAFGFDQALKAMARSDARQAAASISNQTRAMFANVGRLPTFTETQVLQADILPGNIVTRDAGGIPNAVSLPNNGAVEIDNIPLSRDFAVYITWPTTGRAIGICNSLIAGAPEGTRVESGPLGLDYTLRAPTDCATGFIDVQYHR